MAGADLVVFLVAAVALTAERAVTLLVVLLPAVCVFGRFAEVEVVLRRLAAVVVGALAFFAVVFFFTAGLLVLRFADVPFPVAFLEAVRFAFVFVPTRLATRASLQGSRKKR
ncbi:MAG: hypothetical protein JSU86_11590 [Phycisphaerales bacterium]|nr:MAG: hypothetical protein JSU86_11590 [Phycisphaerales bacterium]